MTSALTISPARSPFLSGDQTAESLEIWLTIKSCIAQLIALLVSLLRLCGTLASPPSQKRDELLTPGLASSQVLTFLGNDSVTARRTRRYSLAWA